MAEMLTYAPDLRSITQGQGDYTLEFLRYEELPGAPRAEGRRAGRRRARGRPRVSRRSAAADSPRGRLRWWADGNANDRHLPAGRRV